MGRSSHRFGAPAPGDHDGRITGRRLALACLVGLSLALLLAAPSSAAINKNFRIGVTDQMIQPSTEVPRMGDLKVQSARLLFKWHQIETRRPPGRGCSGGRYDWDGEIGTGRVNYDQLVRLAGANGVSLLPVLIGAPPYARQPSASNHPHTSTNAVHDWKCFVRAAVGRYGRGGTFIQPNPGVRPITEWQVWNEPNVRAFAARRKPNPREYGRFLKFTRPHILKVDPRATIVMAGMPEFLDKGMDLKPYLNGLYKVRRIKRQFDVLAIHPYARNARGVKGAMQRLRRQLRRNGDRRRWVWVTETGWATGGQPRNHFLRKTEQGQANQLTKTFRMLHNNRTRFKVGTVHWFRWQDVPPRSHRPVFDFAGLYKRSGEPKPSCRAFARFRGGTCRPIPSGTATASSSLLDASAAFVEPSLAE